MVFALIFFGVLNKIDAFYLSWDGGGKLGCFVSARKAVSHILLKPSTAQKRFQVNPNKILSVQTPKWKSIFRDLKTGSPRPVALKPLSTGVNLHQNHMSQQWCVYMERFGYHIPCQQQLVRCSLQRWAALLLTGHCCHGFGVGRSSLLHSPALRVLKRCQTRRELKYCTSYYISVMYKGC